jgi:hypothetical protein
MVGSIILFAIPRLGLGFFFSTYRLLIKGAMKNYRKTLLHQIIQSKIQEACIDGPGEIQMATYSVRSRVNYFL